MAAGALAGQSLLSACSPKPIPEFTQLAETTQPSETTKLAPASDNVLGIGRGIYPGRVVWGHNPQATVWDGLSDFWWNEKFTDQNLVNQMFSHSLRQLTGQSSDTAAWEALFTHFKTQRGRPAGIGPARKSPSKPT